MRYNNLILISLLALILATPLVLAQETVWDRVASIYNLDFLRSGGQSSAAFDDDKVSGFIRFVLWIAFFTAVLALTKIGRAGEILAGRTGGVLAAVIATMSVIFIPNSVILTIATAYSAFGAWLAFGLLFLALFMIVYKLLPGGTAPEVAVKIPLLLLGLWAVGLMERVAEGSSDVVAFAQTANDIVGPLQIIIGIMIVHQIILLFGHGSGPAGAAANWIGSRIPGFGDGGEKPPKTKGPGPEDIEKPIRDEGQLLDELKKVNAELNARIAALEKPLQQAKSGEPLSPDAQAKMAKDAEAAKRAAVAVDNVTNKLAQDVRDEAAAVARQAAAAPGDSKAQQIKTETENRARLVQDSQAKGELIRKRLIPVLQEAIKMKEPSAIAAAAQNIRQATEGVNRDTQNLEMSRRRLSSDLQRVQQTYQKMMRTGPITGDERAAMMVRARIKREGFRDLRNLPMDVLKNRERELMILQGRDVAAKKAGNRAAVLSAGMTASVRSERAAIQGELGRRAKEEPRARAKERMAKK